MKVECPHCGFKGKLVDSKCIVCGLIIEEKPPFIRQLLDKILQKKRIVIVIGIIIFAIFLITIVLKNQSPTSSFKKRVAIFENFFVFEPVLLRMGTYESTSQADMKGIIYFYKKYRNCKISYDIRKTDSLVSPFIGYIYVDYSSFVSQKCGDAKFSGKHYFSTIEQARDNKDNYSCYREEFSSGGNSRYEFIFAYQQDNWVLKKILYGNKSLEELTNLINGKPYCVMCLKDNKIWEELAK